MYQDMVNQAIASQVAESSAEAATGARLMFRSQQAAPCGPQFKAVRIVHVQDEADLRLLSTNSVGPVGAVRRGRTSKARGHKGK